MKFNLKALVAAVALATVAGQASANITPTTIGVPGELVFFAYGVDSSGAVATYVKDLGVTFDSFVTTPGYALTNLGLDSNWTAFLGNNALVGDKKWGVFATATQGGTGLNSKKVMTTFTGDAFAGLTNSIMSTAYGNIGVGVAAINSFDGSSNATNNSYYFDTTTSGTDKNLGWKLGADYGTSGTFSSAVNTVGSTTAANFYTVIKTSSTAGLAATVADVDGTGVNKVWKLEGNNLSYVAAVPEPETYGMLAAGLMMLGAVARRRKA